ncbi:MAG TPA: glycosyltransferase family 2 protein [Anaerolineae bacterium]|nr:glycosyltransferase family 2 protein [Anaerolineae bacterium]
MRSDLMAVDLTVSIVNTNNRDLLRECLRTLFENTRHISMEVYVVDNACTDGSAEMVEREFPQVHLIRNASRLRFCTNHNQVLRRGTGRYLLILNEDTEITPGAFDDLVAFMDAHPDAGAAGVTVLNPDGTLQYSYARFPSLQSCLALTLSINRFLNDGHYPFVPLPEDDRPREVDWTNGACLLVRREAMDRAGLLDEEFLIYAEEIDWCYRIRRAGWKVYYLPGVSIYHYQGKATSQTRPRRRFRINRSALLFFRKHYSWLRTLGLRLILLLTGIGRLLIWGPLYLVGWRKARARLEVIYNWRTILISLWRDDMFDAELMQIG